MAKVILKPMADEDSPIYKRPLTVGQISMSKPQKSSTSEGTSSSALMDQSFENQLERIGAEAMLLGFQDGATPPTNQED